MLNKDAFMSSNDLTMPIYFLYICEAFRVNISEQNFKTLQSFIVHLVSKNNSLLNIQCNMYIIYPNQTLK